jgi:hypothetical protein
MYVCFLSRIDRLPQRLGQRIICDDPGNESYATTLATNHTRRPWQRIIRDDPGDEGSLGIAVGASTASGRAKTPFGALMRDLAQ